jgi:flagellar export protein FliJ
MKRFSFPLERVLVYRRSQADIEKAKLAALETQLSDLRTQQQKLQDDFRSEVAQVGANPQARAELGRYRMVVETQAMRLAKQFSELQAQVLAQRNQYIKANQAAEVLVKVKDKQKKTWEHEMQKELDSLAMDSYLSRWKQ